MSKYSQAVQVLADHLGTHEGFGDDPPAYAASFVDAWISDGSKGVQAQLYDEYEPADLPAATARISQVISQALNA